MIDKKNKTVLIYNPLSNIGHFDSWCSIFVKNLLQNEWLVIVVTKNSKKISDDIIKNNNKYNSQLIILDNNTDIQKGWYFSGCGRVLNALKIFKLLGAVKIDIENLDRYKDKKTLRFFARSWNYLIRKADARLKALFLPRLKISAINPVHFADDVNLILKSSQIKPAIILNMYLDLYNPDQHLWQKFADRMKSCWVGIHMDMTHTLVNQPYAKSETLGLIYTINETPQQSDRTFDQPVQYQWLPDVTDTTLPKNISEITTIIKSRALGRNILFLGGAIGGTKNLALWTELIFKLDKSEWFFVQIGKIDYSTLSENDLKGLKKLQASAFENVYIADTYLQNEAIFNEIISISSLIWGVYRDFDRSSNILTKAALFSKPILVSNRYLMGRRVDEYKIGMTVSETSVDEVVTAIALLMDQPVPKENYAKYAAVYSTQALAEKLDQSLQRLIR